MTEFQKNRIESIDVLRGIAMVIMALDHVRDYFHVTAATDDPLNLATTTTWLYFTRWVTHFCAPTFVFLSGTSIFLQSQRKSKSELSSFLIKRGIWLILVEVLFISLAWSYNPNYNVHFLQVIWAIGISMVILGGLIHLPYNALLAIGLIIVFGHNLLDIPESSPDFQPTFLWDIMHHGVFSFYPYAPGHGVLIIYPFVPWLGLMIVGYCAGIFFTDKFSVEQRKKILTRLGLGAILLFVTLRFINVYGDPSPWSEQTTPYLTFLSFLNVTKYPPSLLFLCAMIGIALLLLPLLEKVKNGFTNIMRTFGRVAFFYYVLHLPFIHLLSAISFFMRGHTWEEGVTITNQIPPFYFIEAGEGYELPIVYLVWIFVVIALFPLCKWWDRYKTNHREKQWLSYL
jgi:uncharacterized membrane protein